MFKWKYKLFIVIVIVIVVPSLCCSYSYAWEENSEILQLQEVYSALQNKPSKDFLVIPAWKYIMISVQRIHFDVFLDSE